MRRILRFDGAAVLDRQALALTLRASLLVLCAALSLIDGVRASSDPSSAVGRFGLLLTIAILAATGTAIRPSDPRIPILESTAVSLLVVAAGSGPHEALLPYLLAPALDAGLIGGFGPVIYTCGASAATILVARMADVTGGSGVRYSSLAAEWVMLSLLVGALAAWARRLGVRTAGRDEAYSSAFRLVNQLRTVARHLQGGLDALHLGQMLLQDLQNRTGFERGAVFAGGGGDSLVPLASLGHSPDWPIALTGDALIASVWQHQRPATASAGINGMPGMTSMALPLVVGTRTIGVVAFERRGSQPLTDDPDSLDELVSEAALRIETALLFSEVRAIATTDERKRLAREIHDGIAQDLAFLGYALDDLAARSAESELGDELRNLRREITRVVSDLRMSIYELRSEVHSDTTLGALLSDFVGSVGSTSGLKVHVTLDESQQRLPVATEAELLRIAQEAVNNARKHAEATSLWVDLAVHPPRARLRVADDGRGLQEARRDSYGLHIMRERAANLGAELTISSRESGGTVVDLVLGGPPPATTLEPNSSATEMSENV